MKAPEAYYNEIDPWAAQFLRNLIDKGYLPYGVVDERSITDVQPDDLIGFTQCHFFAGIGGWGLAARLAGWPDWREIWTGSCPCQPFSVAGKGAGTDDARHLWPDMFRLVRARRPLVVMGEQVAAAAGKHWLDGVLTDLEGIDYASRALVLPACAVNAPHRRDRLWWISRDGLVGDRDDAGSQGHAGHGVDSSGRQVADRSVAPAGGNEPLADTDELRGERIEQRRPRGLTELADDRDVANADSVARRQGDSVTPGRSNGSGSREVAGSGSTCDVDVSDSDSRGQQGFPECHFTAHRELCAQDGNDVDGFLVSNCDVPYADSRSAQRRGIAGELSSASGDAQSEGHERQRSGDAACDHSEGDGAADVGYADLARSGEEWEQRSGQFSRLGVDSQSRVGEFWATDAWVIGYDGKARRVEPGIRLLAHGVSGRVAKLRAGGNAIVPGQAAEVIAAYAECYPV